jgi:inorganic phosphate transporter, PiT family
MGAIELALPLLIGLIVVALLFDFLNGLHDAANAIATIVSTRVLRPHHAVAWAAFFNFIAFLFFGAHVARTVGTGIIAANVVDPQVVFGALLGAIVWNVITWLLGIPSSSSHALIGGLLGAGIAKAGISVVVWNGVIKTASAIVLSPLTGFALALILVLIVSWLFVRFTPYAVDSTFRNLQFVSASLYSLGHGGNDAQKTMGIIAVLLYSQGYLGDSFHVPFWVVLSCYAVMGLGTLTGGWRIVKTMGSKITRLTPVQGFCAETGGAITLFAATYLGIPVSTTHTITGCIIGVGAARRVSAVRWKVTHQIVLAWIITIPAAGAIAAVFYGATKMFG